MGRTIQQIFNSMIVEKETFSSLDELVPNPDTAQTFLDDLTSGSKVAIWRLWLWVVAAAIFVHEGLFDQKIIEIEAKAQEVQPGTLPWYRAEAKDFQNGFSLVFNETTRQFEYTDTTSPAAVAARIVTTASARTINSVVTLKIAKTVADVVQKLTAAELGAFNVYLDQIKIAGTSTITISDDPDSLKLAYTIEYDPQLITSTGLLITDNTIKPIQVAIDGYITAFTDENFDHTFRVSELTDAIQAATGVVNAVADVAEAKSVATSYLDILAVATEDYTSNAGYLITVDETGSESSPVAGDINDVSLDANFIGVYATTGQAYSSGDFVTFDDGTAIIMFKANTAISAPAGAFNPTEWDSVSSITYISI